MSILQRPGWVNRQLTQEATHALGSDFDKKFKNVFVSSGAAAKPHVGGPHMERWKFIAAVIFNNPELQQIWPMVVNPNTGELRPWALKANHITAVAEQPEGEKAIEMLKTEVHKALDSTEAWEALQASIHSHRGSKTEQEYKSYKGSEFDSREKAQQLAKLVAKIEGKPYTGGSKIEPISKTPPTDEELVNADKAVFKMSMIPLLASIPIKSKHSYADSFFDDEEEADQITVLTAMGDYPQLIDALFTSDDVYAFLDKIAELTNAPDPSLSDIAQQVFDHVKRKLIKGAEGFIDDAAAQKREGMFKGVGDLKVTSTEDEAEKERKEAKRAMGSQKEIRQKASEFWAKRGYEKPGADKEEESSAPPFGESTKLTPKQTDQLLQEKYVKTRQYLVAMEEQHRQH